MFAEKQRSELMDLIEKNKDYKPTPIIPSAVPATFGKALLEIGKKYLVDEIKSIDVHADECNILITSDWGTYWYRNPYCQPPPTPKNLSLNDKLRRMDLSHCGSISFGVAYCTKATGEVFIPNADNTGGHFKVMRESISLDEIFAIHKAAYPDTIFTDKIQFLESGGGTGDSVTKNLGNSTSYKYYSMVGNYATRSNNYPLYYAGGGIIEVSGSNSSPALNAILDDVSSGEFQPEVYKIDVSSPNAKDCPIGKPPSPDPPPPPPPPPPPMPECCPGQANNDALLKLILKRIGTLPTTVLTSHLTKNGVQPATPKTIESLTDFVSWFAERFDETIGEFEITVQVNNPDDSGKSQTIHLPNLAEAIAEMFTMMIHNNINNEILLNIANRTLVEAGQIKQSDFKIFNIVNAISDYLGFHTQMNTEKMPLTFTPGKTSFSTVLVDSEQDVAVVKYKEKETMTAAIHTLLQAAAIIRGVHYMKTPGDNNAIVAKLKESLGTLAGENGSLSSQINTFIQNVEKVYDGTNKPG